jgi:hypothetical protein
MKIVTPENVKLNDWITVGKKDAIVCFIYENESNRIEVVYMEGYKAINEDVHYVDGKWTFVYEGPAGGYADNNGTLISYVRKLRAGRKYINE